MMWRSQVAQFCPNLVRFCLNWRWFCQSQAVVLPELAPVLLEPGAGSARTGALPAAASRHVDMRGSCSCASPRLALPSQPGAARPLGPLLPAGHSYLQRGDCLACSLPLEPLHVEHGCYGQAWLLACMHATDGGRGWAGGGGWGWGAAWQRGWHKNWQGLDAMGARSWAHDVGQPGGPVLPEPAVVLPEPGVVPPERAVVPTELILVPAEPSP